MKTKYCPKCNTTKKISAFTLRSTGKYYRSYCRDCENESRRDWSKRNPEKVRELNRISGIQRTGISITEYENMNREQDGKCSICGVSGDRHTRGRKRLYIDHDHTTGKIRGLLCTRCNFGLGYFQDDPVLLSRAIDYLNQYS